MFSSHVITPEAFARRFVELMPDYLPGMDTGAFESTDRRRCWNKTLTAIWHSIGKEKHFETDPPSPPWPVAKDQLALWWLHEGAPVFALVTGWGDRNELEASLRWMEAFKCPQKLFVYSCLKWHDAVLDQIRMALLHYPYHITGEEYFFMNLLGAEHRFHLGVAEVRERSGGSYTDTVLRTVPGSPFSWKTSARAAAVPGTRSRFSQ